MDYRSCHRMYIAYISYKKYEIEKKYLVVCNGEGVLLFTVCGQMLPGQLQHFSVGLHLYSDMFHTSHLR